MSELRVDNIVSQDGSAAPVYSKGIIIGVGQTLTNSGDFVVGGATSIAGTVEVSGLFKANTLTPLTGDTVTIPSARFLSVGGGVTVANGGNLDVTGNLDIDGGFAVGGAATITGSVDVQGTLRANTLTPLTGDTVTIPSARFLSVGGGVTVANGGNLDVTGNLDIDGDATISGVTTVSGTLDVDGAGTSNISGDVNVTGALNVLGGGTLNTTGIITATNLNVTNSLSFNSVNVSGASTISSVEFSSGTVTANNFVGNLSGTATTSTNIDISSNSTIDTTTYVVLVGENITGGQQPFIDNGSLTYDGSSNVLTAGGFDGDGSQLSNLNASNISSGTISDSYLPATISSDITGNAATFTVSANNSTNETVYPVFVDGATGTQGAETDTALSYNPSTNVLTAGTFSGSGASLTSLNASNISSGTISDSYLPGTISSDITGNAATATEFAVTANNSTNENVYPVFVDGATGTQGAETDTALSYNPSTNVFTAGTFSGSGASLTSLNAGNISSGTLAIARGGTNSSATPTSGGAAYGTGSAYAFTSAGTSGQILTSNGTSAPTWQDAPGGFEVTDDTSTNSTYYPVYVDSTSGQPTQTSVASTKLQFNPSTGNFSATQFTSLSDASQKTNIRPIENPIELTKQLKGVRFDWIDNGKESLGLIAQEVEEVVPELIETGDDGLKRVNYSNMIGLLIETVKEQQVRIEELERRLNA